VIKRDELALPYSCLNRAKDDEIVFVILGRDAAAPHAIREWAAKRIALGKNAPEDAQIVSALRDARKIEKALAGECIRGLVDRAEYQKVKVNLLMAGRTKSQCVSPVTDRKRMKDIKHWRAGARGE